MQNTFHMLLYRAFHAQRSYLRTRLGDSGLGAGQPKLLAYLDERAPCSQRELADYFEIDPAAVSRMLLAMEKGGFITRHTNPESRRCDLIELTERGKIYADACRDFFQEMEDIMLNNFTKEEQKQFAAFLTRAYQNYHAWKEEDPCRI